jgi:hypothetical protein
MVIIPDSALRFGFSNRTAGSQTSRTIMLDELRLILAACPPSACRAEYRQAAVDENALLKPTRNTRVVTFRHPRDRYGLDPHVLLFRALRDLWDAEEAALPLLGMLAAIARDPLLRATADVVLTSPMGATVEPGDLAKAISQTFAGRFSDNTLIETGRRAASSWQQSGHLSGKAHKTRVRDTCRPVAVAYALFLGYLCGAGGDGLFSTLWASILDEPAHLLRAQAADAARSGWIDYRSAGAVTDVGFRHLLRDGTMAS